MLGGIQRDGFQIIFQRDGGEIGYREDGEYMCFAAGRAEQADSWINALFLLSEMERSAKNEKVSSPYRPYPHEGRGN